MVILLGVLMTPHLDFIATVANKDPPENPEYVRKYSLVYERRHNWTLATVANKDP